MNIIDDWALGVIEGWKGHRHSALLTQAYPCDPHLDLGFQDVVENLAALLRGMEVRPDPIVAEGIEKRLECWSKRYQRFRNPASQLYLSFWESKKRRAI